MTYIPERGDIVWITMDLQIGHELKGRRPAVIISPAAYNKKVGLAVCCSVTSEKKGNPFEVIIPEGLPVEGVILSDQVGSLDWKEREAIRICKLPLRETEEVLQKLSTLVALKR